MSRPMHVWSEKYSKKYFMFQQICYNRPHLEFLFKLEAQPTEPVSLT